MTKSNYYFRILTALTLTAAAGLAALLVASAPALGQEGEGTSPYDQETGVYRDTNVSMYFWGALDPTTVNTSTFKLVKQGTTTPVSATVTYDNGCERSSEWMWYYCAAVLDPQANLEANTTYTATIKGGENGVKWASSYGGTPTRSEDYSWSFTTGATTRPPETTITSGPCGPYLPCKPTTSTSATFAFTSSIANSTFECSLDSAAFTSCTSPKAYTGLSDGTHTFQVRATDASGNTDPTPAGDGWTVDTKVPTISILSPAAGATLPDSSFSVSGSTEAASTVELFESATSGTTSKGTTKADSSSGAWSIPLSGVSEGTHTYYARATDAAGNTAYSSSVKVTVADKTGPTVTESSLSPASGATNVALNTSVKGTFSEAMDPKTLVTTPTDPADPKVGTSTTVTLVKDGTTTPISAKVSYNDSTKTVTLTPLSNLAANTKYTGKIKGGTNGVKDVAGNQLRGGNQTSGDYWWSFTTSVDGQAPSPPTITSPQNNTTVSEDPFSVSGSAEAASTVELFEGTTSKGTTKADSSSGAWSIDLSGVSAGAHTYSAKATDAVGNTSSASDSVTVTVEDKTSPTVKSVYPDRYTSATRQTDIAATFSEEMDPKTLITTPTDPADPKVGTSTTVTLVKDGTTTPISAKVMYTEYWNDHRVILSPPYHEGFYLDANTKYTVKIKGATDGVKDVAGNQLGGGNQASGDYWWSFTTGDLPAPPPTTTPPPPPPTTITAPTNVTATLGGTKTRPQVTLKWTENSNEDNFVVERSEDNGQNWKVLTSSLAANTTSYTDKTVVSGSKTYTYRVKATKGSDSSAHSNTVSVTTK